MLVVGTTILGFKIQTLYLQNTNTILFICYRYKKKHLYLHIYVSTKWIMFLHPYESRQDSA